VEGRVDAFKSVLPSIQQVSDRVERSAIVAEISEYLKLDRHIVAEQLRPPRRAPDRRSTNNSTSTVSPNELLLLACLLLSADARETIKQHLRAEGILHLLEMKSIFECMLKLDASGIPFSMDEVSSRLEPRLQRILAELSFADLSITEDNAEQQALHCLKALETKAREAKYNDLKRRIRELEQRGDLEAALGLMTELDRTSAASSNL
jgi:hypothetical protein